MQGKKWCQRAMCLNRPGPITCFSGKLHDLIGDYLSLFEARNNQTNLKK